jgi:hypothetical protein
VRVAAELGEPDPNLAVDSGSTPEELLKARFDMTPGDAEGNARAKALRDLSNPRTLTRATRIFNLPDGTRRANFRARQLRGPLRLGVQLAPPQLVCGRRRGVSVGAALSRSCSGARSSC